MSSRRDLGALLGSRICHDLISPLGAIGNGVELLTMTMAGAAPEIALISESVESANARIRFFRVAYGAAPEGQSVPASEIRSILADMGKSGRLSFDWHPEADVPRPIAKLAFLAIQCVESAMPWGGSLTVTLDGDTWRVTGQSERTKIDEALWGAMLDPDAEAEVTSAQVQFALLPDAARRARRSVRTELGPSRIEMAF